MRLLYQANEKASDYAALFARDERNNPHERLQLESPPTARSAQEEFEFIFTQPPL